MSLVDLVQWDDLPFFDSMPQPVVARMETTHDTQTLPLHTHPKGQLILALHGYVTCEVAGKMWMVPSHSAIWIPPHTLHSNRAYNQAKLCHVFIQPGEERMPQYPCTLAMTALSTELICHFAALDQHYASNSATQRMATVLIDLLSDMSQQPLDLPLSNHPIVANLAQALFSHPDDRKTLGQWAAKFATTERTLARLIKRETGMSFGKWRNQIQVIVAMQHLTDHASVQQVSEYLGYNSVSAFITMFKKVMGQPPKRYVKQLS